MSQIFGFFRNRNIAKITVPLDSARFFALRPLQGYGFFHLFTSDFLTICICTKNSVKTAVATSIPPTNDHIHVAIY